MSNYRMDLEYEGTRYRGWQFQKTARSIVGELREALAGAGCPDSVVGGAGRTDAGVHALRQTAHLRLRAEVAPETLRGALNDRLPPDIHVLAIRRAAEAFQARHDALARSYLYQIARRRSALGKRLVWWVKRPLDAGAMARAATIFAGRHDFRRFCERPAEQTSTLVEVDRIELIEAGNLLLVRLVASHFLWKMVRRVIGGLVRVGGGEATVEDLRALLDAPPRRGEPPSPAGAWTAPPSGLFLERVLYPGEPPLAPPQPVMPLGAELDARDASFLGAPAPLAARPPGTRTPPRRGRRAAG